MIESLWESAKTLTLSEWAIVLGTLLACTFLGFAPGFGVGIALAILTYVLLAAKDTVSILRKGPISSVNTQLTVAQGVRVIKIPNTVRPHDYQTSSLEHASHKSPSISKYDTTRPSPEGPSFSILRLSSEASINSGAHAAPQNSSVEVERPTVTVLRLSGYVCEFQWLEK